VPDNELCQVEVEGVSKASLAMPPKGRAGFAGAAVLTVPDNELCQVEVEGVQEIDGRVGRVHRHVLGHVEQRL
jgi:hypothetical protein